jgi:predicted esterase
VALKEKFSGAVAAMLAALSSMRRFSVLIGLALACLAPNAGATPTLHTVGDGQTLGKIAKRYNVSIAAICTANGIERRHKIRAGQRLLIPDPDDKDGTRAAEEATETDKPAIRSASGAQVFNLPGYPQPAYVYEPVGAGRLAMKPVIVYLHGRGGSPEEDCKRWSRVARRYGWLVCPSGPSEHGGGRAWDNNWLSAHTATMAAITVLRARYGRRVQLYGNTLVGFSEGAYAAMNVGVREPRTFNRWLILAANSTYWGGPGLDALATARERVRRVYLITGERDSVLDGTREVDAWLRRADVDTKLSAPSDLAHELALERKPFLYEQALRWLDQGGERKRPARPSEDATASR